MLQRKSHCTGRSDRQRSDRQRRSHRAAAPGHDVSSPSLESLDLEFQGPKSPGSQSSNILACQCAGVPQPDSEKGLDLNVGPRNCGENYLCGPVGPCVGYSLN